MRFAVIHQTFLTTVLWPGARGTGVDTGQERRQKSALNNPCRLRRAHLDAGFSAHR
jgi:hypothetical protein